MLLSGLLDPRFVLADVPAGSVGEMVSLLLDAMYAQYSFKLPRTEMEDAIRTREAQGGTTLPAGLAIPHARIDLFNDIVMGVALPQPPVVEDGHSIHMVVLILTSRTTSNLYLNCLAAFARIARNPETFRHLLEAKDTDSFMDRLDTLGGEVFPELTVGHIMSTHMRSVSPDTSIRDVVDLFCEQNLSYLPVLDDDGDFLGELTVVEILRLGIPNYAQMVGNLDNLKTFEPMEELLAREDTLKARDIMEAPTNTFAPETSVVEAVFTFTKLKRRHVPVLDGHRLVGILSYMDVLRKVLRP